MIDAAHVILVRFHREHLEKIDYTNINRIRSLFRRQTINNQHEISRRTRGRQNTAVNAESCVFNVFVSKYPRFLTTFLDILSCTALNPKPPMKARREWEWSRSSADFVFCGQSALDARCCIHSARADEDLHVQMAMLAAASWLSSELFNWKLVAWMNMMTMVDALDCVLLALNSGLSRISAAAWVIWLIAAGTIKTLRCSAASG